MFARSPRWCLAAAVFALLFAAHPNFAQTTFGSIVGTVNDASGSPVADAKVTLTNIGTTEQRPATTSAEGLYQFVNLPPGQYRIDVERTGFKKEARTSVTVATASTTRIDFALQVGELNQTVEVTAQTPLLQAETSSLGQVIDQKETNNLPLNGRNPMSLVALVPSVVPQGGSQNNPNGQNPFAWGNYQIGGGQANQSTTWLDGSPVNAAYLNLTALIPTQDSLAEFKVQTNALPPEYGRFAGGVVNFTTKSGTNQLHGSVWEFLRNRELNANTFFNNSNGTPRPAFTQNQFGFNLGGPVYIPKIYDGRNKTFFFVDWEGFRLRQGLSTTQNVPTPLERTGNLSELNKPIYDPLTTCNGTAATPIAGYRPCAAGEAPYSRLPFAGGIIPQNRLNPTALKMLDRWYPLPNATGKGFNFAANGSGGGNNNETVVHIDQNVSDKQHISARYTYWGNLNLPVDPLRNGVCQDRCQEYFNTNNFVISDTYSFNPTTILEARASYQRFIYDRTPETVGLDLTTLGLPASLNSQVLLRDLTVGSIQDFDIQNTFGSNGAGSIITSRNDNYRVASTLTKILGTHQLQFGAEWTRMTQNYIQTNNPSGAFSFDRGFTASNGNNATVGGAGLASFLLGYAASGSIQYPAFVAGQQLYPAVFFNDNWHASSKLTINAGLRWEHSGPWTERYDRLSFFDPNIQNPVTPQYKGAIELVNSQYDNYRSNIRPNWMQFSPRLGLAYQFAHNTVFHAGYGIFFLPNNVAWNYSPNNDPINGFTTPYTASVLTGLPASSISNPFPGGVQQFPGRNPIYQRLLIGQGPTSAQLANPYGYAQQFNADIQHQFGQSFLVDVAYAGSRGVHLPINSHQIDQLPDQFLSLGDQLTNNVPNPIAGIPVSGSLQASTVQAGQLLRPYPQYNGVTFAGQGVGNSTYNSLQVTATKRFSGGNQISVAYTHSKLISDTDTVTGWLEAGGTGGYQDNNNLRLERSLASFDTPDRVVVTYVLDVPVGKGRRYLSNSNGLVQAVLGGWAIQGTTTFQSGFPLHFGTSQNNTHSFGGGSRPNVAAGCEHNISGSATDRLAQWFDTSCFTAPAPFTFGNEPRVDPKLRAQGIDNTDFAAVKDFPFGSDGRYRIQFRSEFFNIFNRVQFSNPGQTQGTSNFGVVTSQYNNPRLIQFALRFGF
jgi:hypothetical protein